MDVIENAHLFTSPLDEPEEVAMQTPSATLTTKLAELMARVSELQQAGRPITFGSLRDLLGARKLIILPSVKNQHEVSLPDRPELMRVTVIVEISLIDTTTQEQLTTRWVGQSVADPLLAYQAAITSAIEDFLRKTFLVSETPDLDLTPTHAPPTTIRRQPHGASVAAPAALPQVTVATAEVPVTPANEDVEPAPEGAADESEASKPPLTQAWKAANALWRALVNEVAGHEVMDAFEQSLEVKHDVSSWRAVSAEQIRACCSALNKRSATCSDTRKISDREEYILSQLPKIPSGSSLTRLEGEMRRLLGQVVEDEVVDNFMNLYLQKMRAEDLSEVSGRAAVAMCRKLRRLKGTAREEFIAGALAQGSNEAA